MSQTRFTAKQKNNHLITSDVLNWRIVSTNLWGDVESDITYRTVLPTTTGDMKPIIHPQKDNPTADVDFFTWIFRSV